MRVVLDAMLVYRQRDVTMLKTNLRFTLFALLDVMIAKQVRSSVGGSFCDGQVLLCQKECS
jgi:hypothetical protein